jgi:DNA-binding XRE family transcriptional regulator
LGTSADRARWDSESDLHHHRQARRRASPRLRQESAEDPHGKPGDRTSPSEEPRLRPLSELVAKWEKDPEYQKARDDIPLEFLLMLEISKARARSGLTQAEIAKRMGTTQSAVARLETERLPSLRTLKRYAEAVGAKLVVKLELGK